MATSSQVFLPSPLMWGADQVTGWLSSSWIVSSLCRRQIGLVVPANRVVGEVLAHEVRHVGQRDIGGEQTAQQDRRHGGQQRRQARRRTRDRLKVTRLATNAETSRSHDLPTKVTSATPNATTKKTRLKRSAGAV